MTPLAIEEVQAISNLLHRDHVFLGSVLQNELFKEQKSPFMRDLLSDLDQGFPGVLCCQFCAVWTLAVLNEILDLENLLEDGRSKHLLLNSE